MKKTLYVAGREFMATVSTKGFVFGILLTPLVVVACILLIPKYMTKTPPKTQGEIVVVDPSGRIEATLADYLKPERFAERREKAKRDLDKKTPEAVRQQVKASPGGEAAFKNSIDAALGSVPHLSIVRLANGSNVEALKEPLKTPLPKPGSEGMPRLAVIVLKGDAITPTPGSERLGTYDLFIRDKLDDRLVDDIAAGMKEALIAARLESTGLDPARMKALTTVERPDSVTVTATGDRETNEALNILIPAAFMILLLVSVMTSGQYLLTSTVEEKSTRVVEVLLSAVSATQLMTGKILGQMAVGFLVLVLYAGMAFAALVSFASAGLLDPALLAFLFVFYVLAYFSFASMMAAAGSAVNEMREAQSFMTPVMLLMMVPWLIWLPLTREPNSMLAVTLSFLPPFSNFVMLLRMSSVAPPPLWQAMLAVVTSAAGAVVLVWVAAKIFRVGLLMFGKPPTFATLVKWARMA